jgi:hypothetical protein
MNGRISSHDVDMVTENGLDGRHCRYARQESRNGSHKGSILEENGNEEVAARSWLQSSAQN